MTKVAIVEINKGIKHAIEKLLQLTGIESSLVKESGEVYLKPNGIDFKPFTHTSPAILEGTIEYLFDIGASKVYVMENSTQANSTRVVFEFNGYSEVCKRTGAKALFLDEKKTELVKLPHFDDLVEVPRIIMEKFVTERDSHTYISIPKLKTHSMTTVTLGIKNQMAFLAHRNRGKHHNFELHRRLADIYSIIKPDYTIIDGQYAVFNGHYPLEAFLNESLDELGILIGGEDTLAVDMVGARVLGYAIDEIKHLSLVRDDHNGIKSLNEVKVMGELSRFAKRYPRDILNEIPDGVKIVRGKELLCKEGHCHCDPSLCL